jgi:hypothetical protein
MEFFLLLGLAFDRIITGFISLIELFIFNISDFFQNLNVLAEFLVLLLIL